MDGEIPPAYVGQVERDPQGLLWAVLYFGDHVVHKEQVRSLRKGKRRVADLVLSAGETFSVPKIASPTRINRLDERKTPGRSRRPRERRKIA